MTKNPSGAISVFVKTPGLSPIKTRLAEAIGQETAESFHLFASQCVESVIGEVLKVKSNISPYWAIAEKSGLSFPAWSRFEHIYQGEGDLGERLSFIYDELLKKHSFVIFLGADSPQILPDILIQAVESLNSSDFVIGPAEDGGFYLFAGKRPISKQMWLNVPYSSDKTFEILFDNLHQYGRVHELSTLLDIDTFSDLKKFSTQDHREDDFTIKQKALLDWTRSLILKRGV
ncbi:MAG: TIGR04282 family arsenosugar biosynthesis glycosyltransferase [Pseudobdellovibrionaceae bacterium]